MNKWVFPLLLFIAVVSCKQAGKHPGKESSPDNNKTHLPVIDLLHSEIRTTDEIAGGILRKARVNGKKDSAYIDRGRFKAEAMQFLRPELDSAYFNKNYAETALMDETTGMVNFLYTAKTAVPELRKVIVYIKPGLSADRVSRIYMEIQENKGNGNAEIKMTWKMKAYFLIAESRQGPDDKPETQIEKIIWDPEYFTGD